MEHAAAHSVRMCEEKETNIRSSTSDIAAKLTPTLEMNLE